jgi:hypothetical protein
MPTTPNLSALASRIALAVVTLVAFPAWSQAPVCSQEPDRHGTSTVCRFPFARAVAQWTVPPGVTSVAVLAHGAKGGSTVCHGGGVGAIVHGDFTVTPGETLSVLVGGTGMDLKGRNPNNGAGGGGGSFVWRGGGPISLTNVMAVGAGGGGAGCEGGPPRGGAFQPGGGALNGVGGDRTSGVAGTGGQGGGGGDTYKLAPPSPGKGGGGGGGILSDGKSAAYFAVLAGRLPDDTGGKGGKSIASGGDGGLGGFAFAAQADSRGERDAVSGSIGGIGGYGGGGGGGGWFDGQIQARCTGRYAGGGGGGGGYSGGGGGYSAHGSICGKTGFGGGGGGSFVAKDTTSTPTMRAGDIKYNDGWVWIGYHTLKPK